MSNTAMPESYKNDPANSKLSEIKKATQWNALTPTQKKVYFEMDKKAEKDEESDGDVQEETDNGEDDELISEDEGLDDELISEEDELLDEAEIDSLVGDSDAYAEEEANDDEIIPEEDEDSQQPEASKKKTAKSTPSKKATSIAALAKSKAPAKTASKGNSSGGAGSKKKESVAEDESEESPQKTKRLNSLDEAMFKLEPGFEYEIVARYTIRVKKDDGSGSRSKRHNSGEKDPNAPKKPSSAFFYWLKDYRAEMMKRLEKGAKLPPDLVKLIGNLKKGDKLPSNFTAIGGQIWRGMSKEQQEPYKKMQTNDQDRYISERDAYKTSSEPSASPAAPARSKSGSKKK
jgi:hypothetical protein